MNKRQTITELEKQLERFFQKHSAKRVACAAILVGVLSIGSAFIGYSTTLNPLISMIAFAVVSLIGINLAMLWIVPPTSHLRASKNLIVGAVRNPRLLESVDSGKVHLLDSKGESHVLNKVEQKAWSSVVIPHLVKLGATGGRLIPQATAGEAAPLTNAERIIMEKEKAELQAKEKEIEEKRAELDFERKELELRMVELRRAENLVIERLTKVERTEVELQQLREDVERRMVDHQGSDDAGQIALLKQKEAELLAKEAELERHKQNLEEDRKHLEFQKTDLNQLKGDLLRQYESGGLPESTTKAADASTVPTAGLSSDKEAELLERERLLEARMQELESAAAELEERSRYVSGVEDSLIDRLNALTEREAFVEQSEVNAGVRED